jgi:hypothetical protein
MWLRVGWRSTGGRCRYAIGTPRTVSEGFEEQASIIASASARSSCDAVEDSCRYRVSWVREQLLSWCSRSFSDWFRAYPASDSRILSVRFWTVLDGGRDLGLCRDFQTALPPLGHFRPERPLSHRRVELSICRFRVTRCARQSGGPCRLERGVLVAQRARRYPSLQDRRNISRPVRLSYETSCWQGIRISRPVRLLTKHHVSRESRTGLPEQCKLGVRSW